MKEMLVAARTFCPTRIHTFSTFDFVKSQPVGCPPILAVPIDSQCKKYDLLRAFLSNKFD